MLLFRTAATQMIRGKKRARPVQMYALNIYIRRAPCNPYIQNANFILSALARNHSTYIPANLPWPSADEISRSEFIPSLVAR